MPLTINEYYTIRHILRAISMQFIFNFTKHENLLIVLIDPKRMLIENCFKHSGQQMQNYGKHIYYLSIYHVINEIFDNTEEWMY